MEPVGICEVSGLDSHAWKGSRTRDLEDSVSGISGHIHHLLLHIYIYVYSYRCMYTVVWNMTAFHPKSKTQKEDPHESFRFQPFGVCYMYICVYAYSCI